LIAGDTDEYAAYGARVHYFEPSHTTQVVSEEAVGPPEDSFHFKDVTSDSNGSGVNEVTGFKNILVSMSHHDDAGTQGPLAISAAGITAGSLGDSFHFKDEGPGHYSADLKSLAGLDQSPASITHHDTAAWPQEISETQTTELSLPGHHSADNPDVAPHHPVQHDLIV
jgi:hypothetical protein